MGTDLTVFLPAKRGTVSFPQGDTLQNLPGQSSERHLVTPGSPSGPASLNAVLTIDQADRRSATSKHATQVVPHSQRHTEQYLLNEQISTLSLFLCGFCPPDKTVR